MARKVPVNIADAKHVVAKMEQGRSTTLQEVRAALRIMARAYDRANSKVKTKTEYIEFLQDVIQTLKMK